MPKLNLSLFLTLVLFFPFGQCRADDYLAELIRQADNIRLSEQDEWHNLLHYQQHGYGDDVASIADSPNFFLAKKGKYDPRAELSATLTAFFSRIPETDTQQNPQCAFIARYQWLKSRLHFDPQRLPEQTCRRFNDWYHTINPYQVTLVFPAAYVNNPSSMFGHTLLRIDRPNQDERTRLISYAINYAAETTERNGVVFATRAILGGYPGYFSVMPYYEKVKEYSDLENRDIWEYQLTLKPAEIKRLLEHAWELGPVRFDYFFFDENCSYQLLTLLDVARPGLNLSREFPGWVIPSDTVRAILDKKGLLKQAVYRPSSQTLLQHQLQQLDDREQQLSLELAQGQLPPTAPSVSSLTDTRRAMVLEAAYDYLQYQFNTGKWPRDEAANRSLGLLRARSRIAIRHSRPSIDSSVTRPDLGHDTARLAVYTGRSDELTITDIYLRPAYHDLLDTDTGYQPGAQINFFDLHFRRKQEETRLETFTLIDIASLTPRDRFFSPVSWRVSTGLERFSIPQKTEDPLLFNVRGGGGLSYRPANDQTVAFMLEGALLVDNTLPDGYVFGIGPSLQWLWANPQSNWKFSFSSRLLTYHNHIDRDEVEHHFQTNLRLDKDISLRLSLRNYGENRKTIDETRLGLHWYF